MRQLCTTRGLESHDMKDMALIVAHVNLDVNSCKYTVCVHLYFHTLFSDPENENCLDSSSLYVRNGAVGFTVA